MMTARAEVPAIIAGDSAVVGFNPEFLGRAAEADSGAPGGTTRTQLPESFGPDPYEGVD